MNEHTDSPVEGVDAEHGAREGHRGGGKQLERLCVPTGRLLIIDQFMLSNGQFLSRLPEVPVDGDAAKWCRENDRVIRQAAHAYGGSLLELSGEDWAVFREPQQHLFVLAPFPKEGEEGSYDAELLAECRGNAAPVARVFIDTRCVVFVDAGILAKREVMEEYKSLRSASNDKAARDLIRQHGAAVRYGFNREGDELGVFPLDGGRQFAFWPDVVESLEAPAGGFDVASTAE